MEPGAGRGIQRWSVGSARWSASGPMKAASRSTPEIPSIRQWCTFEMTAKRPPSRPSTNQSSHIGLSRSSFWDMMRPTSRLRRRSSPGSGSAVWRTW
jgi:hypothetical protein